MIPSSPQPGDRTISETEMEQLSAMMDGELAEAEMDKVSVSLGQREEVRKQAESMRKTWELLDVLPRPLAPTNFTEQTLTRLDSTKGLLIRQGTRWKRLAILGWVAAIACAGLLGFWMTYFYLQPKPEAVDHVAIVPTDDEPQPPPPNPNNLARTPTNPRPLKSIQEARAKNEKLAKSLEQLRSLLRPKLTLDERLELARKSAEDPLDYIALLLELAKKYKINMPPAGKTDEKGKANNSKKPE